MTVPRLEVFTPIIGLDESHMHGLRHQFIERGLRADHIDRILRFSDNFRIGALMPSETRAWYECQASGSEVPTIHELAQEVERRSLDFTCHERAIPVQPVTTVYSSSRTKWCSLTSQPNGDALRLRAIVKDVFAGSFQTEPDDPWYQDDYVATAHLGSGSKNWEKALIDRMAGMINDNEVDFPRQAMPVATEIHVSGHKIVLPLQPITLQPELLISMTAL